MLLFVNTVEIKAHSFAHVPEKLKPLRHHRASKEEFSERWYSSELMNQSINKNLDGRKVFLSLYAFTQALDYGFNVVKFFRSEETSDSVFKPKACF